MPDSVGEPSAGFGSLGYNLGLPTGILHPGQFFQSGGRLSLPLIADSMKWLLLGGIVEAGRRLFDWLYTRLRPRFSTTLEFNEGNPPYDWIVHFLTEEKVWKRSREFRVSPKTSKLKWSVETNDTTSAQATEERHADYVPTFYQPQLFNWRGHVIEVHCEKGERTFTMSHPDGMPSGIIHVTIYTRNISVMSDFVEATRLRYLESSKPNVIIHMVDVQSFGHEFVWNNVKSKAKRPLTSVILGKGIMNSLLDDAKEFMNSEEWYVTAGIPYRRGYLLHGPPGTGKSSTIYALAGELGLDIYALSLASGLVDDSFLQRAAASIPKGCIFLIEDVDCCFSRDDDDDEAMPIVSMGLPMFRKAGVRKSAVSMSALLNVIDGVGSEAGRLFFATTNYIDHLDSAFLRPGRIDKKVEYFLATKAQAASLFLRFFPVNTYSEKESQSISELAQTFAEGIPEHEFSTAELQGYLLLNKRDPVAAAQAVKGWVEQERLTRKEREQRLEEAKKKKMKAAIDLQAQLQASQGAQNGEKSGVSGSATPALVDTTTPGEGKRDDSAPVEVVKESLALKPAGNDIATTKPVPIIEEALIT